jgi:FKBP-type peptidyl-prolyl cis-trans isomerase
MVQSWPPLAGALALAVCATLAACQACGPKPEAGSLSRNADLPGVVSVPGVQYRVLASGPADGPHPSRADDITVVYEGRLTSGKVFSATDPGKTTTFPLGRLIPAWTTVLPMMRPGDEWMIWVPPQMGYGFTDHNLIPAGSVLIFKVKLVSIAPHAGP